jgi:hypothetical protein
MLMCAKHWRMVPKHMQDRVWATFRVRGNYPGRDPGKWADYYEACADAVEHVAMLEHKDAGNSYRRSAPRFRAAEKAASEALSEVTNQGEKQ